MPEEKGKITEIAQAVAAVTESVPVYQDAVQPAAQEVGKGLQLVARSVNAALAPLEILVWGVDTIRDFLHTKVTEKLRAVPPGDICQPEAHVAVPAIEALRYVGPQEELSEMYANLLATSMDIKTALHAHPAFVDIIKNMTPDEARILHHFIATPCAVINLKFVEKSAPNDFVLVKRHLSLVGTDANCEHPSLAANYLDNLVRLGLIEIPESGYLKDESAYKRIEENEVFKSQVDHYSNILKESRPEIEKLRVVVTDLGKQFISTCVIDKAIRPRD